MRQKISFFPLLLFVSSVAACGGQHSYSRLSEESTVQRLGVIPGGVHGLTVNASGDFFYSDSFARGARNVYKLKNPVTDPRGGSASTGISGNLPAGLEMIGSDLLVCDTGTNKVSRYDVSLRGVSQLAATQPWNVAQAPDGSLLSVSYGGSVELLRAGQRPQILFSGLDAPFDLVTDEDGHIWVSEQGAEGEGWVTLRRRDGSEITRVGPFDNAEGLVLAADGTLWIADTGTGKIHKYDRTSGELTLHTDKIDLPIAGTETRDGTVVFNGRMDGQYGLFAM